MSIEEALKLLGLNRLDELTEESLKKSYRALAKIYHPDALVGKSEEEIKVAEEKLKQINDAYETLRKNLINRKNNSASYNVNADKNNEESTKTDYTSYVESLVNKMMSYYKSNIRALANFNTKYEEYANEFKMRASTCNSKREIDALYQECIQKIKRTFDNLRKQFIKLNNLPEINPEKLNYNSSLDEFYYQLIIIKEEFRIKQEVEKYNSWQFYEELEFLIHDIYLETTKEYRKKITSPEFRLNVTLLSTLNPNQNVYASDSFIQSMHSKIEALFKNYVNIANEIKIIKEFLEKYQDIPNDIREDIKNLFRELSNGYSFYSINSMLYDLIKKIKDYKLEDKSQKEKMKINEIRKEILNKINTEIDRCSQNGDSKRVEELIKLRELILEMITKCEKGEILLSSLDSLTEVNFDDLNSIYNILNEITKESIIPGSIYLKKSEYYDGYEGNSIYYAESMEDAIKIYHVDSFKVMINSISLKELNEEYVSLDLFLLKANYCGKIVKKKILNNESEVHVLYRYEDMSLCLENGKFFIDYKANLDNSLPISKDLSEKYCDKDYIKGKLMEQIQPSLDSIKNSIKY